MVAILGSVAVAQPVEPPEPAPAPTPPACTARLDLHAVDASTHEALAMATVRVDGVYVGDTGDDGSLVLTGLCPGPHAIEVERGDYRMGTKRIEVGPGSSSVEISCPALELEVIEIEDEAPPPTDMRAATVIDGKALERTRGRAFSDALAEVPGVSQLRSASGMAKPIVRGQFGRRLLLLVDGVRHRAQEWGLDHAPEIDPFAAGKLTVVRGAAGVQYGPDAIGGAVLADPPPLLREPGLAAELHLVGISNGRGGNVAARLQHAGAQVPGLSLQLEGSLRRLAAPSTPDYALDNTGVEEWNVGAAAGYRHGDGEYRLSYSHYQARLGVCSCLRIESSEDFYAQIERERPVGVEHFRADFEIERPYQAVAHDLALARARWSWDRIGSLGLTYGFQHDRRREYDVVRNATTGPQYAFRLFSHDVEAAFAHNPVHLSDHLHLRGSVGVVGLVQTHRYTGLPLVPDHHSLGAGVFAIERLVGHDFELEAGVRYDLLARTASIADDDHARLVRSGQLSMDACPSRDGGDTFDCASRFHTLSASLGALRLLTEAWSVKVDLSTAARPPSTDEQYLNGTAPSFPVLGLGKPDLGAETTYSASLTTSYRSERVTAEASAYANLIADYIYFAPAIGPDGEPIFDVLIRGSFPRFVTRAVDATFYGGDGGVTVAPHRSIELGAQVSIVRARNRTDDGYLVFVPPDQARGSITYKAPALGALREGFVTVDGTYVARQRRYDLAADFAPPPPAYFLLGAEVGAETDVGGEPLRLALHGSNLTNARHRDYTSLLRYFVDQPGWQLMLRASLIIR